MPIDTHIAQLKCLIVDDEEDNLSVVSRTMEFFGATTKCYTNSADALEQIDLFNPNFLLLDIGMPFIDGYELLRQIRAKPHLNNIPAVALTAFAFTDDQKMVKSAGFDGCLIKPYSIRDLIDIVKLVLQRRTAII